MKKLILSVIFMLSVTNSARAYRTYNWTGWDTNAWPSTKNGKVRWSDTNTMVLITNIWAYRTRTTYFVTNFGGTEALPKYNINGYVYDSRPYFDESFPAGSQPPVSPVYVPAGTHSNWFEFAITSKTYYAVTTNYVPNLGIVTKDIIIDIDYNGDSILLEEKLTRSDIDWYKTNLIMQASDIRGYDCYNALVYIGQYYGTNTEIPKLSRFFYRNEWENVTNIKDVIVSYIEDQFFRAFPGYTSLEGVPDEVVNTDDQKWVDYVLDNVPTNYLRYTPVRGLDGRSGLPRVLTNYFTIRTDASGIVTQNFTDYLGNTNQAIGTNGQEISIQVTNSNVQAGYTTADYGWKHMDKVVSKLRYQAFEQANGGFLYIAKTNEGADAYFAEGQSTNSYAEAVANAEAAWQAVTNITETNYFAGVGDRISRDATYTLAGQKSPWLGEGAWGLKFDDWFATLYKSTANSLLYRPDVLNTISNRPANLHVYYYAERFHDTVTDYSYTNNTWSQLNASNQWNYITIHTLATNIEYGGANWIEITGTNGISAIFNDTKPNIPSAISTNYGTELGWFMGFSDHFPFSRAGTNHLNYVYMIFDWQHPWVNVITN